MDEHISSEELSRQPLVQGLRVYSLAGEVNGAHWVQLGAMRQEQEGLVGSAAIVQAESDTPTLVDVFAHKAYRRKGIGRALVRAATRWADQAAKDLYLHVLPANVAARQLYKSEGFEFTGEVKDDSSLWMVRRLSDGCLGQAPVPPDA